MPILAVEDLSLQYGRKVIFEHVGLAIEHGDRLGIVGANGTGKTTLMRIMAGQVTPDGGRVSRARGCRIGYLPQEHSEPGEGALLDTVLSAAPRRDELEQRVAELESELGATDDPDEQLALAGELAELHAELQDLDHQFGRHRAERILSGLGFAEEEHSRPVSELSGGWRMRAALAALLFQKPEVMLLDEPTNHLDLPSVNWLNTFLDGLKHTLILTCHDREFLNRHINRVVALESEGVRTFRGNYDRYLSQRELDLEYLEARARKDELRKRDLEAFVTRFKAKASKARQAQSKARMIEKMQEQRVDLPAVRRAVSIKFAPAARAGDHVIRVEGLHFAWSEPLFRDLDLTVRRQDRIAIVGTNGAGKTTLLKLLANEITPQAGRIVLGHNVTPSYFAQHHTEILDKNASVLSQVWAANPSLSQAEARTLCGAFLFSDDEVEKPIGVLSGGEKARVALARMLAQPGNLLLLDEPTNHLDTEAADKLTASLEGYDGTLLFVSHNLDFARRLSNKVWDVRRGKVETYPGSLADYLDHLSDLQQSLQDPRRDDVSDATPNERNRTERKEARLAARRAENAYRSKKRSLEQDLARVEGSLESNEARRSTLEEKLADPETHRDLAESRRLSDEYAGLQKKIETLMADWERLSTELDALVDPAAE